MTSERELREQLAISLELHRREELITYNGHLSARLPEGDRILITPWGGGLPVTAEDLIVMDLGGRVVSLGPKKLTPPSEWPIHTCIYRARSDVMAIAHLHPPISTFFGIADTPIVPVHVSGTIFGDGVPVLDEPDLIRTVEQGERLAKMLGPHRAVLMRGHGAVTVGGSVEATFTTSIYLEENCRHQLAATQLGKPRPYTADEVMRVRNQIWGSDGTKIARKAWVYYLVKHGLTERS